MRKPSGFYIRMLPSKNELFHPSFTLIFKAFFARVPAVAAAAAAAPGGSVATSNGAGTSAAPFFSRYVPELGPLWREQPLPAAAAGPAAASGGAS